MKAIKHIIYLKNRKQEIELCFLGDFHFGSQACDKDFLARSLKYIGESPLRRAILMGDLFEAISRNDIRYDAQTLDQSIFRQSNGDMAKFHSICVAELAKMIEPAKNNIIAILDGNHEDVIRRRWERDLIYELCNKLYDNPEEKRLGYHGVVVISAQRLKSKPAPRRDIIIHCWHGAGGAVTDGAKINNRLRMRRIIENAHIYASGHQHDQQILKIYPLRVVCKSKQPYIINREAVIIGVPSFFKTYIEECDTYAAKRGYPPSGLGMIRVIIKPFWGSRMVIENKYINIEEPKITPLFELG